MKKSSEMSSHDENKLEKLQGATFLWYLRSKPYNQILKSKQNKATALALKLTIDNTGFN